ncbi:MAG: hypothetical protein R6U84_05105 [Candidatus Cloacimonadales bacterium]
MNARREDDGFRYRNRRQRNFSRKNTFWSTAISALAGVVVKDLSSPNSKLKQIADKLIHPKRIEHKSHPITTEYQILDKEIVEDEKNSNSHDSR